MNAAEVVHLHLILAVDDSNHLDSNLATSANAGRQQEVAVLAADGHMLLLDEVVPSPRGAQMPEQDFDGLGFVGMSVGHAIDLICSAED